MSNTIVRNTESENALVSLNNNCFRGADKNELRMKMAAVLDIGSQQSLEDAFVLAFHARNIRGGKGERDVFAYLLEELIAQQRDLTIALIDLVPEFGSWNDLFELANDATSDPVIVEAILETAVAQLRADGEAGAGEPISLVAKWAPRETKMKPLAVALSHRLFPEVSQYSSRMRLYRKLVSRLNLRLETVETKMCDDSWSEIDPASVHCRARKIYNRAFLNLPSTYNDTLSKYDPQARRHYFDPERVLCRMNFMDHYAAEVESAPSINFYTEWPAGASFNKQPTLTPYEFLRNELSHSRYDIIRERVREALA